MRKGFSIIEMLVVIAVFSILAIVTTQTLSLSLRGSRKSDAQSRARQNVDYAMSTMERLLRNAQGIVTCTSTQLVYLDEYDTNPNPPNPQFRCLGGANGYIASGAANLQITSSEVKINCTGSVNVFMCPTPSPGVPRSITITVTGTDASTSGAEGNQVTSKTKMLLRTYD